jgi:hypothetical protein
MRYDTADTAPLWKKYNFELTFEQDVYLSAELYQDEMYPKGCGSGTKGGLLRLFRTDIPSFIEAIVTKPNDQEGSQSFIK